MMELLANASEKAREILDVCPGRWGAEKGAIRAKASICEITHYTSVVLFSRWDGGTGGCSVRG